MALTLAKYFNGEGNLKKYAYHVIPFVEKNFWGKDLIFLMTSHDEIGMQAWIDDYMGTESSGKRVLLEVHHKEKKTDQKNKWKHTIK